ncbi:MAG: DUF4330 domain-containing protein [Oscillospiraceae bacterium]|nr:DUF4330 domain-containing protein [Oscillospiraceae bacterium]
MNNKEKRSKFNVIDLLIILFVVAACAGIAMRYNLADQINLDSNGETFLIEFVTAWDIQEESQQYFSPGVSFYVTIESIKIGEITDILDVRNPAVSYVEDGRGNIVKTELPGRVDVKGVMKSTGRITKDGEFMINGNMFVAPNQEFFIHTGKWEGRIRIISMERVGE